VQRVKSLLDWRSLGAINVRQRAWLLCPAGLWSQTGQVWRLLPRSYPAAKFLRPFLVCSAKISMSWFAGFNRCKTCKFLQLWHRSWVHRFNLKALNLGQYRIAEQITWQSNPRVQECHPAAHALATKHKASLSYAHLENRHSRLTRDLRCSEAFDSVIESCPCNAKITVERKNTKLYAFYTKTWF